MNTHDLRAEMIGAGIYPARDFDRFCGPSKPDVFVTYDWRATVIDIQNAVWEGMDHLGSVMQDLHLVEDPEPIIAHDVRIWMDWIFIDQSNRDIEAELDVLPDIIDASSLHFVFSSSAMTRSWCCWEIGRFNMRFDQPEVPRSLMAAQQPYEGWDNTEAFDYGDKLAIEARIKRDVPGGMEAFEMMMLVASSGSLLGYSQTGPAIDNLENTARRIVERARAS